MDTRGESFGLALRSMRPHAAIVLSLSLCSCAAVFRGTSDTVFIESNPPGATATQGPRQLGTTPTELKAQRSGVTQITLTKDGYDDHHGAVKKTMNGGWLALDIVTCIIPVAFCIPLLVDAVSGAWYDIEERYVAAMKPRAPGAAAPAETTIVSEGPATPPPASGQAVTMSESERKATARAAYLEGVKLQESGACVEALHRFEVAQKLFDAPTHLLHMGQCQAATGKLVEAAETYEELARKTLPADAPEVFRHAQDEAKRARAQVKPRIPTLRIQLTPPASSLSSLVVKLNGNVIPNELLGIARPVNPGTYKVTVWAAGYKEAADTIDVGEGVAKALTLKLAK